MSAAAAAVMPPDEFVAHVFAHCGVLPAPAVLPYGHELNKFLHVGPDHVASPDTGQVALLPALVELDACAREIFGAPLLTNAGFRTVRYERDLTARGYKAASYVSPHSVGCALDKAAAPSNGETLGAANRRIQLAYREAAGRLKLPCPRFGHRGYGERFTHVDLVFMLFAPYTTLPHPMNWTELPMRLRADLAAWRPGVEW